MHYVSVKKVIFWSHAYNTGLLKKKDEQNVWAAISRDYGEVKGCNQRGCPCIARLEGLNCVTLQHSEGIRLTTYQCLLDAILELVRRDS